METVRDFIFLGSKISADGDYSHEIKRYLFLVRKAMTNLMWKWSRVRLFATPWTVAHQAPPSMEFSRQEYWSGLPFPSPRDLPNLGIESRSPSLQADPLPSEPPGNPMTNLNSILKSRDITLLTKVHLFKDMVFPVVMYGCESWAMKKAERWRIDAFELSCWSHSWESLGLQGDPTSQL